MKSAHNPHHHKNNLESKNSLYRAIDCINTAEEAKLFFEDLCSLAEITAMADRWEVVKEVKADKPYRQINEEIGVSVTTVGRVARCIAYGTGGYNLIFNRCYNEKQKET